MHAEEKKLPLYVHISGLFSIILIIVKLVGYRDWPWWVVLLPIYCPLLLFGIALIILGLLAKVINKIYK